MFEKFEAFIRERKYLQNVTPATLDWYKQSLRWLPTESPTDLQLRDLVINMRQSRKATGRNCAIRAINAYLKWSGSPLKIPKLKEPELILPTFTSAQVVLLVRYRAKLFTQRRLHLMTLLLLDTGARILSAFLPNSWARAQLDLHCERKC
ncbi:MAG: hypothetical protein NVS1B11_10140 [Terriglobales bacterium]